jgi:hypothetical protein
VTDVAGGEDPWRRHLHAAVDYILDGPGSGDMDEWATQALASLGVFFRAAGLALDYEAGRIKAGDLDRRRGIFPAGGYVYPLWHHASIDVEQATADAWCQHGRETRDDASVPAETAQRILAAIFHPIANASCDVWLCHLADALDALQYGERPPLLEPSSKRIWGKGHGRTAYSIRLRALAWAEFQKAGGLMSKTEAIEVIADEFDLDTSSIRGWYEAAEKQVGPALVNEEMQRARNGGLHYRSIKDRCDRGIALDDASTRLRRYFEVEFGSHMLKSLAATYCHLPRKRARKVRAARRKKSSL